jgi:hypothetical protein
LKVSPTQKLQSQYAVLSDNFYSSVQTSQESAKGLAGGYQAVTAYAGGFGNAWGLADNAVVAMGEAANNGDVAGYNKDKGILNKVIAFANSNQQKGTSQDISSTTYNKDMSTIAWS